MLREKTLRFEHAGPLFRSDEEQGSPKLFDLCLYRLKLSHAFDAVRSPRPTQKFQDRGPVSMGIGKREQPWPVRGRKAKARRRVSNPQGI